ncbi:hypothetical protein IVB30_34415 [Bradyrhizobium sp. 200]|uniref:hypothetical protein n=1 Tax=Bradyrhizobium sp. 200 TaxID=2782665 RepID=UPI002000346C|nr:hypothetical protein [Bradyrhizobium sp. 200]UPJ54667.1 hypothetical protein IVB30_34415 [Bradyrhizobium sp. 200]
MLNLVCDLMAGSLAASVPLPASTLEEVSLAAFDLDQSGPSSPFPQCEIGGVLPRLGIEAVAANFLGI